MDNGDRYLALCIPKDRLQVGMYYAGKCRNANIARWDGEKFVHWRYKFGWMLDDIEYWDVDGRYDGFLPMFLIGDALPEAIPLATE